MINPCYTKKPIYKADLKIAPIYGNIIFRFGPNFEEIETILILKAVHAFFRDEEKAKPSGHGR